jgi:hypothetical protein
VKWRALRAEPRLTVGTWTRDLVAGNVYDDIPEDTAAALVEHGSLEVVPDDTPTTADLAAANREPQSGPGVDVPDGDVPGSQDGRMVGEGQDAPEVANG